MVIAQMLTRSASEYDRKHQQIDADLLGQTDDVRTFAETTSGWVGAKGEVETDAALADQLRSAALVHVYGAELPSILRRHPTPYVASFAPPRNGWLWNRLPQPAIVLTGADAIPESVADEFFDTRSVAAANRVVEIGSRSASPEARRVAELTIARIARLRSDVRWKFFDVAPAAGQIKRLSLWVDPSPTDTAVNTFVAEALAADVPVVAARTPLNELRLERGTAGLLVKPNDPNELAHAVLSALFKPEVMTQRREVAQQVAARLRPEHRIARLRAIYTRATS